MKNNSQEFKFNINGIEKKVIGEVIDQKFWCIVDHETYCFDVADLAGNASGHSSRQKKNLKPNHLIKAPMPGKITKVFIKDGDSVQKSQALLVMEAMKMEYTLKSDLNTVVEKLNVKVGDQVILGHLLIQLQPETEKLGPAT